MYILFLWVNFYWASHLYFWLNSTGPFESAVIIRHFSVATESSLDRNEIWIATCNAWGIEMEIVSCKAYN